MKVVVGASLLGLALALPAAPGLDLVMGQDETSSVVSDSPSDEETADPNGPDESEPATGADLAATEDSDANDDADDDADVTEEAEEADDDADHEGNARSAEMTALAREHQDGMRAWRECVRALEPTEPDAEHVHGNCIKPTPPGHVKNGRLWKGGTSKKAAGATQAPRSSEAPRESTEPTPQQAPADPKPEKTKPVKPEKTKPAKTKPAKAASKR